MITNFLSRIPFDTPFWKELFFVFRLVLSEILFSPLASFLSLLTPRSIFVCHLYIVKEYCKKTIPPCLITPRLARFDHLLLSLLKSSGNWTSRTFFLYANHISVAHSFEHTIRCEKSVYFPSSISLLQFSFWHFILLSSVKIMLFNCTPQTFPQFY